MFPPPILACATVSTFPLHKAILGYIGHIRIKDITYKLFSNSTIFRFLTNRPLLTNNQAIYATLHFLYNNLVFIIPCPISIPFHKVS